jgi:hypothetical protein
MSWLARLTSVFSRAPRQSASVRSPVSPTIQVLQTLHSEYETMQKSEPTTRLPTTLPAEEFRSTSHTESMSSRIAKRAWRDITDTHSLKGLVYSVTAIASISGIEAVQMLAQSTTNMDASSAMFVGQYALGSILPSCTWSVVDPALIAASIGADPAVLLDTSDASTQLLVQHLSTVRHLIATSTLFRQLFRLSSVSLRVKDDYKKKIKNGDETPFDGLKERVVRLCGSKSDVTVVSLQRFRDHIFPVYEFPHKVKYLVRQHSENFSKPVYWRVSGVNYGQKRGWENLRMSPDWLLSSTIPGRYILTLEADLVNDEDSLSLDHNISRDLTMGQATDAFRSLTVRAKQCMGGSGFRVLRVVLGDSMEIFTSGGGHSTTLRERVVKGKEADLLVDSRAPVWLAVLDVLEKVTKSSDAKASDAKASGERRRRRRRVLLFTDSAEYFNNLKQFMKIFDFDVEDGFSELKRGAEREEEERGYVAGFVLFSTTASTITHTLSLYQLGILNHVDGVCALVDKQQGYDQLSAEKLEGLSVVCSSIIHDDLFRSVRIWSRMGFSPNLIQEELDFRFARILEAETTISIENVAVEGEEGERKRRENANGIGTEKELEEEKAGKKEEEEEEEEEDIDINNFK